MMLMEHEEGRGSREVDAGGAHPRGSEETRRPRISFSITPRAYLRLLREHIQKEDEILFRIADDVIPPDEQKQLLRSFEEHEAKEIGTGVHEKYLKLVEELERGCP